MILKSVEEEAFDCRKRCADLKVGDTILHCHHEVFMERLTEPVENRISYIIKSKRDNVALRLRLMGPVVLDAEVLSDSNWGKANADLDKAYTDWVKASSDWKKANADWRKVSSDLDKVNADLEKAYTDWRKAYTDWVKASSDLEKAYADWRKVYLPHYRRIFPDSPWDGHTIFAGEFKV